MDYLKMSVKYSSMQNSTHDLVTKYKNITKLVISELTVSFVVLVDFDHGW